MGSLMQEFSMEVPYRSLLARPTASSAILYQEIVDIFLASGLENKSRLVAFNVERGAQPGAVVTTVVAENGGALGRRSGRGEKRRRIESIMPVSISSNAARIPPGLHLCKFRNAIGYSMCVDWCGSDFFSFFLACKLYGLYLRGAVHYFTRALQVEVRTRAKRRLTLLDRSSRGLASWLSPIMLGSWAPSVSLSGQPGI